MVDIKDVYLELPGSHVAIRDVLAGMKPQFQVLKDLLKVTKDVDVEKHIKQWLREGPSQCLTEPIREEIQRNRKQLKMFLLLSYSDTVSAEADIEEFRSLKVSPFECHKKHVTKKDEFYAAIDSFLNGEALNVAMPVVLVAGRGSVDATSGKLVLHINSDDKLRVDEIHNKYWMVDQIRFIFHCNTALTTDTVDAVASGEQADSSKSVVLCSNAQLRDVLQAENEELQKYHSAIIGDGPLNSVRMPKQAHA